MAQWFVPLKDAARWIWLPRTPEISATRSETALFHLTLTPPEGTRAIELHVSAEGRYTLWIGDSADPLGQGPARTDRYHRSLDNYSLDVSDAPGKPVQLWSQVRFAPFPEAPIAEMLSPAPAFLVIAVFLDDRGEILGKTGTSSETLAARCEAFTGKPIGIPAYFAIGQTEHQRSSGFPKEWRSATAPKDPIWQPAAQRGEPYFHLDPDIPWSDSTWLVPREIPHMEYEAMPIREIRRVALNDGPALPCGAPEVSSFAGVRLAPNETAIFRCDLGELALAYYRLRLSGKGTTLSITSSEVLASDIPRQHHVVQKSFDLDSNLPLIPLTDSFTLDTDSSHTFESSHWRAFRFLELTLTAGPEGGAIESFTLHATGYPFQPDYAFDASSTEDQTLQDTVRKAVNISWRTLKRCTWETYMDCPYYEQLQYIGDTRIQCLLTYLTTGDPTLPAQALRAFDRSRIPEGLTQSRYPSTSMQIIPTFSLIYIMMIEDYLLHIGDDALVAELRPGIAPILNWFTRFIDPDSGLIGYVPYWPFVDWVNGWNKGVPPHAGKATGLDPNYSGANASVNILYLLALQSAASIYERAKAGSGNFYHTRAKALKQRLYDAFYDRGRGLVCDVPVEVGKGKLGVWSQHAQALAILADLLSPTEAREALGTALHPKFVLRPDEPTSDTDAAKAGKFESRFIAPASFYFLFYVAEAVGRLRMGEQFWPLLAPFRDAIARGSTTWPEAYEPCRSECHAWSAWPLYFFARHILGIAPPSPEDSRIRVQPLHCPPIDSARGHFQTHAGPVSVNVSWNNGQRQVDAQGPRLDVVRD